MFAIKSARQWTNTDSLRPPLVRFNKYPPINFLSPFSGFLSSFSIIAASSSSSSASVSSTSASSSHASSSTTTSTLGGGASTGANGTILFVVGRLFVRAFILRLLSGTRRRHMLYATPPPLALYNRPLPALVCISLTLTLRPILFAVSSISPRATTRRGISAVDAE